MDILLQLTYNDIDSFRNCIFELYYVAWHPIVKRLLTDVIKFVDVISEFLTMKIRSHINIGIFKLTNPTINS